VTLIILVVKRNPVLNPRIGVLRFLMAVDGGALNAFCKKMTKREKLEL